MDTLPAEKFLLSVIVPCYNEAENLMPLYEKISPHLDGIIGTGNWQLVFISNGCKDQTPQIIEDIQGRCPATFFIKLKKPDYGNALHTGLMNARGEYALIINVDFWHAAFISWAWRQKGNYDLIIGSKRADPYLDQRPKYRQSLSWGLNGLLQFIFGAVTTDTHGQKLICMQSMRPILDRCVMRRGQFDTEFVLKSQKAGLKIAEVPVPIVESRKQKNLMIKKIAQNLVDLFILKKEMKKIPQQDSIYYHRYATKDVYGDKPTKSLDAC